MPGLVAAGEKRLVKTRIDGLKMKRDDLLILFRLIVQGEEPPRRGDDILDVLDGRLWTIEAVRAFVVANLGGNADPDVAARVIRAVGPAPRFDVSRFTRTEMTTLHKRFDLRRQASGGGVGQG